jgi:hypothetical protein
MSFQAPVDIANRALQHCGVLRIGAFTDLSKNANEVAFTYDKVRRAELRRVVWRFATRRTALRQVNFLFDVLLSPAAWVIGTTYPAYAIVSYGGVNWVSTKAANLGNTPGLSTSSAYWVAYTGPMTIQ